uniref:Uncharacterized protein n=1 Tax=Arundo donax TaxID=35708 RepID=A0A0A8YKU7_ARUDO
MGVGGRSRG